MKQIHDNFLALGVGRVQPRTAEISSQVTQAGLKFQPWKMLHVINP